MEATRPTNGYATSTSDSPTAQFAEEVLVDGEDLDTEWLRQKLARLGNPLRREEQYHDFIGVSNTDLGNLDKHPLYFYKDKILGEEDEEESLPTAYLLGNMIECQLLFPHRFEDQFIREPEEMKSPSSPNQKEFCQHVINGDSPEEAFRKCYSTKRKSDEKIAEKASEKYESLRQYISFTQEVENSGKDPYTAEQKETVNAAVLDVKTSSGYQWLESQDGTDLVQYPLVGLMDVGPKSVLTKGLADWLIVGDRQVISIDLKTTSKPLGDFGYSYHKYRYYRQQGYYREMLRQQFPDKNIQTYCLATKTREPFGTRLFQVSKSLLDSGIEEARSLLERLVLHLDGEYDFQRPLEDQRGTKTMLSPNEDMLSRHLSESSIQ